MVSPGLATSGQGRACSRSISAASSVRAAGSRKPLGIGRQALRIGHHALAHAEGALGGFHQAVNVREAFALGHTQALEQAEDHERREALRGRRQVVDRAVVQPHRERVDDLRLVGGQVARAQRAAHAFELGADALGDFTAVEVVQPTLGQLLQRAAQRGLLEDVAHSRRLAVDEVGLRKTRRVFQAVELLAGERRLAFGDGNAVARVADAIGQQARQGQGRAPGRGHLPRLGPAADGAGHRERGLGAPRGDGAVTGVPVEVGQRRGGAAGRDGHGLLARFVDEPETVTADGVHVRVDHRNGCGCGHHGFHGVAAVAQHIAPGLCGQVVGRNKHAAQGGEGVDHRRSPCCVGSGQQAVEHARSGEGQEQREHLAQAPRID